MKTFDKVCYGIIGFGVIGALFFIIKTAIVISNAYL